MIFILLNIYSFTILYAPFHQGIMIYDFKYIKNITTMGISKLIFICVAICISDKQ